MYTLVDSLLESLKKIDSSMNEVHQATRKLLEQPDAPEKSASGSDQLNEKIRAAARAYFEQTQSKLLQVVASALAASNLWDSLIARIEQYAQQIDTGENRTLLAEGLRLLHADAEKHLAKAKTSSAEAKAHQRRVTDLSNLDCSSDLLALIEALIGKTDKLAAATDVLVDDWHQWCHKLDQEITNINETTQDLEQRFSTANLSWRRMRREARKLQSLDPTGKPGDSAKT